MILCCVVAFLIALMMVSAKSVGELLSLCGLGEMVGDGCTIGDFK